MIQIGLNLNKLHGIKMDKVKRIVTALSGGIPDMVPYMYNTTMRGIQQRIAGHEIDDPTVDGLNISGWIGCPGEEAQVVPLISTIPEVAEILGLDAIQIQIVPPIFAEQRIAGGTTNVTKGLIDSADALAAVRMPDPDDDKLLRSIGDMIKRYKGDFAMGARIRLGAAPSLLSMGLENVAYFYADEDDTLIKTVGMYTDWNRRFNKNLCELDFDFFWAFDDIAFTSNMLISPTMFREIFKENLRKAASTISKPWIFHSDGNYREVLDDIVDLGASGIHPIEKSSMDAQWLKENYGDKLCLIGNIDIDYTLSFGTEEEVDQEVRERIKQLGPGGGYIIADSNSIPDGCRAENVLAMAKAIEKYRRIY